MSNNSSCGGAVGVACSSVPDPDPVQPHILLERKYVPALQKPYRPSKPTETVALHASYLQGLDARARFGDFAPSAPYTMMDPSLQAAVCEMRALEENSVIARLDHAAEGLPVVAAFGRQLNSTSRSQLTARTFRGRHLRSIARPRSAAGPADQGRAIHRPSSIGFTALQQRGPKQKQRPAWLGCSTLLDLQGAGRMAESAEARDQCSSSSRLHVCTSPANGNQ